MKTKSNFKKHFYGIIIILIMIFFIVPIYANESDTVSTVIWNLGIIEGLNYIFSYQSALIVILILAFVSLVMVYIILETKKKIIRDKIEFKSVELINKSKGIFFSQISHEIRTPMNAIIGITSNALEDVHDPERMEDALRDIQVSSKYLLSLMNDILDVSKMENDSMVLRNEVTSLKQLLDEIKVIIEPQTKAKHIRLIMNMDHFLSEYFVLDHVRLQQVLVNILSNSVKFTNPHGVIGLSLKNKGLEGNRQKVEFVIRDSGIGISPEFLPRLFLPFAQENANGERSGTGLGMVIVKKIVDLMGGKINVVSKKGIGSKFEIDFVLIEATPEQVLASHRILDSQVVDGEGKRVLLVEDNELNIKVAKRILENKKFVVEVARNGKEATTAFFYAPEGYFSAILMDIQMPIMDGLKATEIIRSSNHLDAKNIPIIAMSANAFEEDRAKSLSAGMNEHLTKPIEPALLYQFLHSYIFAKK